MQCPESAPALSVPIVMVINLLAPLSPERSEVAFGEPGSHYHAITLNQQTNSIQRGDARRTDSSSISMSHCHFVSLLLRVPHLRSLDVFPESLKKLQGGVLPFFLFFFLLVQKENRFFCVCMGECAAKKLSTFRAWLILAGFAFPHGCDPGSKSNARTDSRQLNAGPQQSGALHYSNFSQGRKRRKDMCIMPA